MYTPDYCCFVFLRVNLTRHEICQLYNQVDRVHFFFVFIYRLIVSINIIKANSS